MPSFEAAEFTAAPYRGKGLAVVGNTIRFEDHGYRSVSLGAFPDRVRVCQTRVVSGCSPGPQREEALSRNTSPAGRTPTWVSESLLARVDFSVERSCSELRELFTLLPPLPGAGRAASGFGGTPLGEGRKDLSLACDEEMSLVAAGSALFELFLLFPMPKKDMVVDEVYRQLGRMSWRAVGRYGEG